MKEKTKNYLDQVSEFHETFKHPILGLPQIPDKKRCRLRMSLLQEELSELQLAINYGNLVDVADAFCDLQYVLSGAILEFGMKDLFDELFNEVHRSNMSKACDSEEEANKTIQHFASIGVKCYAKLNHPKNNWLVYRSDDDKTMKSINYSPADLIGILRKHPSSKQIEAVLKWLNENKNLEIKKKYYRGSFTLQPIEINVTHIVDGILLIIDEVIFENGEKIRVSEKPLYGFKLIDKSLK